MGYKTIFGILKSSTLPLTIMRYYTINVAKFEGDAEPLNENFRRYSISAFLDTEQSFPLVYREILLHISYFNCNQVLGSVGVFGSFLEIILELFQGDIQPLNENFKRYSISAFLYTE